MFDHRLWVDQPTPPTPMEFPTYTSDGLISQNQFQWMNVSKPFTPNNSKQIVDRIYTIIFHLIKIVYVLICTSEQVEPGKPGAEVSREKKL